MKTKDIVIIAMFTAFIAMLAFIPPIPLPFMPVPIAFQNTGIMLAGCLLGYKRGTLSVVIFLLLVAVGLPKPFSLFVTRIYYFQVCSHLT